MKTKLLVTGLIGLLFCVVEAETTSYVRPKDRASLRQAALERRKARAKKSGGLLERPDAIASNVISIDNNQKILPVEALKTGIAISRRLTKLPITLGAKERVVATISLIESDNSGALVISPEEFKVQINVKKLAADGATSEIIASRIQKEVIRGALMVLGSGYTSMKCYANPITTLKELDELNLPYVSPDTMMHIPVISKLGIRLIGFATYRTACMEGWAPAPANEEQKQIWDEVHAMPSSPIKIKPESKIKK